jgi:RNA polymerase sigma-70 factor (ECF subfamily)
LTSTEGSVTSTEGPVTSTEGSVTSTEGSVTSTEGSVTSTEDPVTSTEGPLTSTESAPNRPETKTGLFFSGQTTAGYERVSYLCFLTDMKSRDTEIRYYKALYMQYAPMLIRFAGKFISPFLAEDIVHDVFLNRWDKRDFLLPEAEIKRILYVAVRNGCIDFLRRAALEEEIVNKQSVRLQLEELDFFEAADELFMRNDLVNLLMKKIDELPERGQEIFRMAYIKEMKAAEIAGALNLSIRTVENQLYRSLAYLRKQSEKLLNLLLLLF